MFHRIIIYITNFLGYACVAPTFVKRERLITASGIPPQKSNNHIDLPSPSSFGTLCDALILSIKKPAR